MLRMSIDGVQPSLSIFYRSYTDVSGLFFNHVLLKASMSDEQPLESLSPDEMQKRMQTIKKLVLGGSVFAAVGFLLVLGALYMELTQFHPLLEQFFGQFTEHSLAGGGPDRAGSTALNASLSEIHKYPSTLLWMKLGGIGHILVGIFLALVAIVKTLSLMPQRLADELDEE